MKKIIILFSLAVLSLSACTQSHDMELPDVEISFDVLNRPVQTKSGGDTDECDPAHLAYYADGQFGTYAWYNAASGSSTAQEFMANQNVKKQSGVWKAVGKTYYWPHTGTLDFLSYSPYVQPAEGKPVVTASATDGISVTGWKVNPAKHAVTYEDDLMYADKAVGMSGNATTHFASGVPTLFHHALAKLNFKVTFDDSKLTNDQKTLFEGIKVTKLEIKNINTKGNFTKSATAPEWTHQSEPVGAYQSIGTEVTVNAANKTESLAKDYLVLPQTIPSGENVSISYQILTPTASTSATVFTTELSLSKVNAVPAWNMNTVYTYNIIISPLKDTPILFAPTVTAWDGVGPIEIEVEEKE